jgi:flagellar assembly factor FliW
LIVSTRRFGDVEIGADDIICFREGLIGLTRLKRFFMVRDPQSSDLFWLQSIDEAPFALATVHVSKLGIDYPVELQPPEMQALELHDPAAAVVFVILNRLEGEFTVNLQGPLVINAEAMLGKQVVLHGSNFGPRHRLITRSLAEPAIALDPAC